VARWKTRAGASRPLSTPDSFFIVQAEQLAVLLVVNHTIRWNVYNPTVAGNDKPIEGQAMAAEVAEETLVFAKELFLGGFVITI
jgi:hypothetical protein